MGRLTPLQQRILARLSPLRPAFTLTGGAALAGVHLGHRATRDVDLFFRGQWQLTTEPADAMSLLRDWPVGALARDAGLPDDEVQALEHFHHELLETLLAGAGPPS